MVNYFSLDLLKIYLCINENGKCYYGERKCYSEQEL